MLKYAEINILDIKVEHLDNTIEHIRWLSHSWTSIFLRVCMYLCIEWLMAGLREIFFLFKRTIPFPVEIIHPMLILLNYGLKLLKRRWYTYTFHVNSLTHVHALSSVTFYSTPYYFLCNTYCYLLWVN